MAKDKERMKSHSPCLNHRFYKVCHAVYQTYCVPCHEFGRGYNNDPGVDHWTVVKIILRYLKRTKEMFLGYAGDKGFVVKGYIDASFNIDPDDSESQSGYILKVGAIS